MPRHRRGLPGQGRYQIEERRLGLRGFWGGRLAGQGAPGPGGRGLIDLSFHRVDYSYPKNLNPTAGHSASCCRTQQNAAPSHAPHRSAAHACRGGIWEAFWELSGELSGRWGGHGGFKGILDRKCSKFIVCYNKNDRKVQFRLSCLGVGVTIV